MWRAVGKENLNFGKAHLPQSTAKGALEQKCPVWVRSDETESRALLSVCMWAYGGFLLMRNPEQADSERMFLHASSFVQNILLWRRIQAMHVYRHQALIFLCHVLNRFCFINIVKLAMKTHTRTHTENNNNITPLLNFQFFLAGILSFSSCTA